MSKIQHDFIIIEPETTKSVLKNDSDNLNSGIVKDFGKGYYTDTGVFVEQIDIIFGDKIYFTQHLRIDPDGEKMYVVRGRDVIKVEDGNKA